MTLVNEVIIITKVNIIGTIWWSGSEWIGQSELEMIPSNSNPQITGGTCLNLTIHMGKYHVDRC